ncbi:MAG: SURF1 family protein [Actinomycetota bacterium]|nr:SURF1 family protein [Actinomycetota bacterium]
MLKALREPRYAALSVLMVLVAAICVGAGTWQIARLAQKSQWNAELRRNARAAVSPPQAVLPVVGRGAKPSDHAVQFRPVAATGTFDAADTSLVRQRTVNGDTGYLIFTPLRTEGGALLVVRGFISGTTSDRAPVPPAPPTGQVTVLARVQPSETRDDRAAGLPPHQVESINAAEQAARLGMPVFYGYAELLVGQPGADGMTPIPSPDLSNPAGGAVEPQHLAYIIQWYLFALLALAAPIAMVRAETRHHDTREIDAPPKPDGNLPEPAEEHLRAAKLADRYGRAAH